MRVLQMRNTSMAEGDLVAQNNIKTIFSPRTFLYHPIGLFITTQSLQKSNQNPTQQTRWHSFLSLPDSLPAEVM